MSASPLKVLIVDDEFPIRKLLRNGLGTQGYAILEAPSGMTALRMLAQRPDLVILDLSQADEQGFELLQAIRVQIDDAPVVVLSGRDDEASKVKALDLGADDYVTKPFGMNELLARLRVALRHNLQIRGERPIFLVNDLSVDLVRQIVKIGERDINLSPKEYALLRVLVQHAGKVVTHELLLKQLWSHSPDLQYLRVCVSKVRQKIEPDVRQPQYLLTENGIGYRLRTPDQHKSQSLHAFGKMDEQIPCD
jgi:two-component system, OmpR family, KDP operon response regulator KdpE